ncbi:hypothetical protein ACNKHU_17660 [Shigella flexneri]
MQRNLPAALHYLKDTLYNPVRLAKDYLTAWTSPTVNWLFWKTSRFNKGEKKDDETLAKKYAAPV